MLTRAGFQCWDSSTSGLDSATSSRFIRNLRRVTSGHKDVALAALYQVSKATYNTFDKVLLLYEGRQIFFGTTQSALEYFEAMGFACPRTFTIPDFLTALTHPLEVRTLRKDGAEGCPQSAIEFAAAWEHSVEKNTLRLEIEEYMREHISKSFLPDKGAPQMSLRGPYATSPPSQLRMCIQRALRRSQSNVGASIGMAVGNIILSLIIGSVFYNLPSNAENLLRRSILLFYIITINAFLFSAEVAMLWEHRPIIEKHRQFAFHRPAIEAMSSMLCDIPNKLFASFAFNIPIYFLSNLRRSVSAFFTFFLFAFVCLMTLSMFFRMAGSFSRSIVQTIVPVGVYVTRFHTTGFRMLAWLSWIRWINPLYFTLESVMINEFTGRLYPCRRLIPSGVAYSTVNRFQKTCSVTSAHPGTHEVTGTAYIGDTYGFHENHLWRNLGILIAMLVFFCIVHLLASEYIKPPTPKGTVLEFRRGTHEAKSDIESSVHIEQAFNSNTKRERVENLGHPISTPILQWTDIGYAVTVDKTKKTIIQGVSGYIKKGEVTALMGSTGAGKTTLLNVLAQRVYGELSGEVWYEGHTPSPSFQRLVGYAQQEDIHLHTATVREALLFSAQLRKPNDAVMTVEDAVDEVIGLLEMEDYADAVVGVPGEGLNLEQRRRLTIAVELAAQPSGILFLDEPTSNLDSQTAWSIYALLRRLASSGLAILCTVHQPSGSLLGLFDKLLLLGTDGRQLYFGEFGEDAKSMISYFEQHEASSYVSGDNPADWMLEVTSLIPKDRAVSWADVWLRSRDRTALASSFSDLSEKLGDRAFKQSKQAGHEFAASFAAQYPLLLKRTFQEFWRSPSYLWSKFGLCIGIALFVGISLWMSSPNLQGLQSQLFSLFLVFTIGNSGMKQIIYTFINRRNLFERREGPSRMYSGKVFVLASIAAELPWQTVTAIPVFLLWYFPTGIYKNAEGAERAERGALLFLLLWAFFVFMATFAVMVGAAIKQAPIAANVAVVLYQLMLLFCGVLAAPSVLPRFWIFMYRVSPLTYLVSGMMSASISNVGVSCRASETITFNAPSGSDCGQYMVPYLKDHRGYLLNPSETIKCQFCPWTSTNSYLSTLNIDPRYKWRDFGIFMVFLVVNVGLALGLYALTGTKKKEQKKKEQKKKEQKKKEQKKRYN